MSVNLKQQNKIVEVGAFAVDNKVVFDYFDSLPATERDEKLLKALYIGVLALADDRLSAFLSKTDNELGTELESLKLRFDLKKELFYKTTSKGFAAEGDIEQVLNDSFTERKVKDRAFLTGNTKGNLKGNKTGDILVEVNGNPELLIAIECKYDKSYKLGNIDSRDVFARKSDNCFSQLIEADANRGSQAAIIVLDASLVDATISRDVCGLKYIQGIGFVTIVDSQKGDYSNLLIAYSLAKDIVLNAVAVELDKDLLNMIISRIIKDINEIRSVKNLVEVNIENCKQILKQIEKASLLLEFNQSFLRKFLSNGTLTKSELLAYYMGDDIKQKYIAIEKEIIEL